MKRDNSMTRRFLADAGISSGMHVIEIGCGGGEVTLLLAELIGSSGHVVAIDRDARALALTRQRMDELNIGHVDVVQADVSGPSPELSAYAAGTFDALVGRRVLMYLPKPIDVLRSLGNWLRSGAVVVFEESDATMVPASRLPMPAHDQAVDLIRRTLAAEGASVHMGFDLPTTLVQAGFVFERIRAEAIIQGQGTQFPLAELVKLMMPRMVRHGVATEAELDVESLVQRLAAERSDPTRVYASDMAVCAWAHKR